MSQDWRWRPLMVRNPGYVSCVHCGEAVYYDVNGDGIITISNHTFTLLPDGRVRWFSRDLNGVTHECEAGRGGAGGEECNAVQGRWDGG